MQELKKALKGLKTGDYVTATGSDTRGHQVTRTGTYLASPKEVKAARNGNKVPAVRVFVGLEGTDPDTRSTWVTLFPGTGTIEKATRPREDEWKNEELKHVPGVRADNHKARIYFGGKGGRRSTEPTQDTLAGITHVGNGRYEVWSVETQEALLTGAWGTQIWWRPAPVALDETTEDNEHQDQGQESAEDQLQAEPDEYSARLEEGRSLGYAYDEAHEYAEAHVKSRKVMETQAAYGKPVFHARTGDLVGYWTLEKFTPIEQIPGHPEG